MRGLSSELATEEGEDRVLRRLNIIDTARGLMNSIVIDAEGEGYDFKTFQFTGTAREIAKKCGLLKREWHPDDDLIDAGYVQIGISTFFYHGYFINWGYYNELTPEQKLFLQPYFENEDEVDPTTLMRWKVDTGDYDNG